MKPLPKPDGGGKAEPNWAKKASRQQKTRNAGRTASNAIQSADRGGSGTGPRLNPDG